MKISILKKLKYLESRSKEIENILSKKNTINDRKYFLKISKEYLKISNTVYFFKKWKKNKLNIKKTKKLLKDKEIYLLALEDLIILKNKKKKLENKIYSSLLSLDPKDRLNCFIEIRAATGGNESSIFSGDLYKMYVRYSELKNWKVDLIHYHKGEFGGFKEIIMKVIGIGSFGRFKFESGGHRVQRVPKTETQGRIHTSTCTVAVMPELPKEKKIKIKNKDLKIDTFRSSGAGGQHVNTTDSAIRITHIPTGIVVECQDERSQHKNKSKALSVLLARINSERIIKKNKENSFIKKNLLGSGFRSDRNRTYNFIQNRVTDHRINLNLYKLDKILEGDLDILIDPIIRENKASEMAKLSEIKL
ncbi:MAG: peptide chain release factor 1 [Buchnera aphidicola (Periphyllus lyropictus)]|uniref:peptide chain release factor 1 n=1 Tax=Buchnera aphidicola TaxID=9 RepID=UPI001EB15886|nr:peptide chain release factor 1 [Buchnera aphidicola]NIH16675.1 peptide chain release factor 1 [Buchnera aphidicola (Periphyllus lyropictus)]USS94582.1 peptide chain release factor 1 [Buchnera aphidicola (Periphyllus lyropictus)]